MAPSPRIARRPVFLVWSLFALANLALFLADLRQDFNQMLVPCSGAGCNFLTITSAEVAALESWGLTTSTYALFMSAVPVIVLVVYWFLGGLVLSRQGAARVGLAVSLALIVLPVSTYAGSNDWSAGNPHLFGPAVLTAVLGAGIMLVFFYLMPSGRFSPRWSWIFLLAFFGLMTVLTLEANRLIFLLSLPAAITIAILRYRLWDIDLVIRRTLQPCWGPSISAAWSCCRTCSGQWPGGRTRPSSP